LVNSVDQYCSKCYNTHIDSNKRNTMAIATTAVLVVVTKAAGMDVMSTMLANLFPELTALV
jgi:hypothetical protein